jgi:hypothetical protein
MKNYILAFLAFIVLSFGGLFCFGFLIGIAAALGGQTNVEALEQSQWLNLLIIIVWPIISFFAFKFSVEKLIIEKY